MKKVLLPLAALVLGAVPAMAGANVYASALKAEDGKISFVLNDAATSVTLNLIKDGTVVATADLGVGVKGLNTVDMPAVTAEPGTYNWSITASAPAFTEVTLVTTDSLDNNLHVNSSRGIAVDNHQQSPAFGNVYTVAPGSTTITGARVEGGVYAFNAALEPINEAPYTGGMELLPSPSNPNNIAVADNGDIFICSWADNAQNGVYWAAPGDLAGTWKDVFAAGEKNSDGLLTIDGVNVHGSVQDIALYGEGAARMLYTSDEDMHGTNGDIMVYAIGDLATPWATAPTHDWGHPDGYVNGNHRLASDGRGGLWLAQYRWEETAANAVIYHLNAEGVCDFQTGDKSVFVGSYPCGSMGVNADGTLMCVGDGDHGNRFTVASISWGEDGIPVLTKLYDHNFEAPYSGKRPFDIAFDAADNVYFVFNNAGYAGGIGAWALPKEKNEYTTEALGTVDVDDSGIEAMVCRTAISYKDGIIKAAEVAEVYSTAGVCVARGTAIDATKLAKGVYIVRAGKNTLRIIR